MLHWATLEQTLKILTQSISDFLTVTDHPVILPVILDDRERERERERKGTKENLQKCSVHSTRAASARTHK